MAKRAKDRGIAKPQSHGVTEGSQPAAPPQPEAPVVNRPVEPEVQEPLVQERGAGSGERVPDHGDGAGGGGARVTAPVDRRFWPADRPLPATYRKARRQVPPCPACLRVQLDSGGQAVALQHSGVWRGGDLHAFFRCKACGHRWRLPVELV